jgi:peptide/nickel transport system substrate-binding protein
VAAACGGDDDDSSSSGGGGKTTTTTEASGGGGDEVKGGELILGAEQFPECLNPITACANSSWMHWVADAHVLPRLMELDPDGNFVPSPVLAGDPELSGEGTDSGTGPFTVTYNLNPDAVWDDGSPITSADISFTLDAYLKTTGTLSTVGYDTVDKIDDSDPATAVVTFKKPFADWQDLWGGNSSYVLKADAFAGKSDVADAMGTELPFSGGPFKLESFSPTEAVLVRNDAYWDADRMPNVDTVRVVPQADSDTEINALLSGEVDAIFPQPAPGIADSLGDPGVKFVFGAGTTFEGLWFNQGSLKNPDTALKSAAVREALMFAIDRDKILSDIIHPDFPDVELLQCGGWVPTVGEWCGDDFSDIKGDPAKVASLLEGDGWAKGSDGIYAKGGKKLSITWQTVAGNARREAIQALIIPALKDLGIELVADNSDADTLFQTRLPQMDTEIGLYAQVASPDPSVTTIFGCANIPTTENNFSGQNTIGWCNEDASALMTESDQTPDTAKRLDLIHQIGAAVRADAAWMPFYQLPLITAWRADTVSGPTDLYKNSPYSGFENIYDWSVSK